MADPALVPPDEIRARFSAAMSRMYRAEVPLYGDLIAIVEAVNRRALADRPAAAPRADDPGRLDAERHGAIRVGSPRELSLVRRAFAVMGMHAVGYYDLAAAGVPVHSTAFRPIDEAGLRRAPFRMFASLLRLELIEDAALRETAEALLAGRRICTDAAVALIDEAEARGGLDAADADRFVAELLETFRWHGDARVDAATYARLHDAHRLLADVVSFRGPHINHLTPRTLDIDAAQAAMLHRGIAAKAGIEGPPRRAAPILLRQTSFHAVAEPVRFAGPGVARTGRHTARFGEIEQRGAALTREGHALYDALLARAHGEEPPPGVSRDRWLETVFAAMPDTIEGLRAAGLAYVRYVVDPANRAPAAPPPGDMEDWIAAGLVRVEPILYEDFLPVSAAGIFQSNLGTGARRGYAADDARQAFEQALGATVLDPFALYDAIMAASIRQVRAALRVPTVDGGG